MVTLTIMRFHPLLLHLNFRLFYFLRLFSIEPMPKELSLSLLTAQSVLCFSIKLTFSQSAIEANHKDIHLHLS